MIDQNKIKPGLKMKHMGLTGPVLTVLWAGTDVLVYVHPKGWEETILVPTVAQYYEEVKEPRSVTVWMNLYEAGDGSIRAGNAWKTERQAELAKGATYRTADYIETVSFTYTEKTE